MNRVGFALSAGLPEYRRCQTPPYIAQQLGLTVGSEKPQACCAHEEDRRGRPLRSGHNSFCPCQQGLQGSCPQPCTAGRLSQSKKKYSQFFVLDFFFFFFGRLEWLQGSRAQPLCRGWLSQQRTVRQLLTALQSSQQSRAVAHSHDVQNSCCHKVMAELGRACQSITGFKLHALPLTTKVVCNNTKSLTWITTSAPDQCV